MINYTCTKTEIKHSVREFFNMCKTVKGLTMKWRRCRCHYQWQNVNECRTNRYSGLTVSNSRDRDTVCTQHKEALLAKCLGSCTVIVIC